MSTSKLDASAEEERLAHALVSRGLLTREEFQQCRASSNGPSGAETLLARLVKSGFLTASQARRTKQELSQLLQEHIPGYQFLEKLGQGSMGKVYKARQLSMNRLVAIKILSAKLASNRTYIARFQREAHLAAKFSCNNVVQAIDVGEAGGMHYFVMEFVEGTTICDELERGKVYAEREALDIVLQVAQALEHAHRRGLIHRDVKPSNIILTPDGIAKLADLGLARETDDHVQARKEKGLAIGTPYYMAVEQIEGRVDIDIRADIYSLGATFYHMVTGQPPFPGTRSHEVLLAHLQEELTPPDHINQVLSSGLGEVIECMMAKQREQRYPTPSDLIRDLECLLNDEPPRIARRQMNVAALKGLAQGKAEPDTKPSNRSEGRVPAIWLYLGAAALGLSLLCNAILLLS